MELWLLAIIALALVPVVRLFMADGCPREPEPPPPPGTESLRIAVTSSGAIPDEAPGFDRTPAVVRIKSGTLEVHPPSGHPTLSTGVPEGGLLPGHVFPVTAEMFAGAEPRYRWSATCSIEFECASGPLGLGCDSRRQSASATISWDWDANRFWDAHFVLRIVYVTVLGSTGGNLRWELYGYPST